MRVLLTGVTGYIGGRLCPRLLERGHEVTVLVRSRRRFEQRGHTAGVRVIEADVLADDFADRRLPGFDAAYYLIHSMYAGANFEERDRRAATAFGRALDPDTHVVYLGGLLPTVESPSRHLRSRAETGDALRRLLPERVTEFRAGPIIGSGSASFEMVRYLTERLPVMVTPRWVDNGVQPIGVRDVLAYLLAALDVGPAGIVPIGADRLTFRTMMEIYAAERGLRKRWIISTPVLAPSLAARWVGWTTPITNRLAVPLVEGVLHPLDADTRRARELFPAIEPVPYREALRRALERTESNLIATRWTDALGDGPGFELADEEGLIREVRQVRTTADAGQLYAAFASLGGKRGWLAWSWAWRLRGVLDQLIGGPGLRRGRRHPTELREGEALDFWRVERVDPQRLLRLRAEMKVPGRAWLQFEARPAAEGEGATLTQTALFEPRGLAGWLYWWVLYPAHALIFRSLARRIARLAEADLATAPVQRSASSR